MSSLAPDTDPEFAGFTFDDMRRYNEAHGGCVEIEFRGAKILAPRLAILAAIRFFRTELAVRQRKAYRREVLKQINHVWDAVVNQRASTDKAMLCCEDIAIIYALDVVEGKATLPPVPISPSGTVN